MQWKNERRERREKREKRERRKQWSATTLVGSGVATEHAISVAKEANKQKQTTTYFGRLSDVVSFFEIF